MKLFPSKRVIVFALLLSVIISGQSYTQEKQPMTLIDLLEVPALRNPQLSPDGTQIVYVLAESNWSKNRQVNHIWRINSDGTGGIQLTYGDGEQNPRWSPDGKHIAFTTRRDDSNLTQIYLLNNQGGEARQLTDHSTSVSNIQWSPDGSFIYFLANDPKTEEEKERDRIRDDVYAFDENYKQRHLWKVSVSDKSEHRVTEGDVSILSFNLSKDGKKIVVHKSPTPLFDDTDESEIYVMDADGSGMVRLTDNTVREQNALLSPDNKTVLFVSDSNELFEPYFNDNIFLVPADGGKSQMLLPDMPHEVQGARWSSDGSYIYFVANTGVRSELFRYDTGSKKLDQLTRGDHSITNWSYYPNTEKHVICINQPDNPGDIWILDGNNLTKVTRVFDYLSQKFLLPEQEAVQWKGEDGETVEGLLFYPLNYREGTRYPLVVYTHGGPASSSRFGFSSWSRYTQVFASLGYAVIMPNYRGSTGYGDEFLRDMVGHYYRQSHLDVMTGVDYLIEQGIADGDRLAKMGWSAGGHMTNKIITFTDRFKAASSGAGAVNWISMYAQSDVRIYRTPWFGGTPWEEDAPIDVYWDHSPLKDIWKVTTPTLILVGENDVRVPPQQSIELYRALKSNEVPTFLYIAPREPHGWRELNHRLFKINVELDWFEKYVMDRTHEWESPPELKKGKK